VSGWKEEFPLTPDKADITPTSLQGPRCITRGVLKSSRKHGFEEEQKKFLIFMIIYLIGQENDNIVLNILKTLHKIDIGYS